jgi:HD-GYP domain-containing protein (c-di-GMP phosphodiesterase class II)
MLHDIGKFAFPDSILFADQRLTDEQWEIVERHPADGARVVRRVDGYGPVADIVLGHHERWDGSGYPNGLAGEAIPLAARLIAAADAYDVLTARDSYRQPIPSDDAIAELQRSAGTQFDPQVVEALVTVLASADVSFGHGDDADFEAELAFEQRVRDYTRRRLRATA